jgi:hypothetical protein
MKPEPAPQAQAPQGQSSAQAATAQTKPAEAAPSQAAPTTGQARPAPTILPTQPMPPAQGLE